MDLETLKRTVDELIELTTPIAQNHPDIRLDNNDFSKLLEAAKGKFSNNQVIQNMTPGEWKNEISAEGLIIKLSTLKGELGETKESVG